MSVNTIDNPKVVLEQALIEEYLNDQGYSLEKLKHLPERVVKQLMKEATRYASKILEELEAGAHLVKG